MSNIFKPIWIIIFTVIPQFIVTLIFYNAFYLTYPLLNSDHKKTWIIFFSILTIKLILLIINAIILFKKKTKFKPILYLILLFFDCSFLYFILTQIHSLFPGTTGRWIINPDEYMLYLVTFFMPSFIFYISSMVTWLTPEEKKNKILPNIIAVIMAPLLIYLVVNSGYSILFAGFSYKTREYITTVFFIISAIIFFFFLFKLIYLISKKITKTNKIILLVIKILFGIIFPITGLILNEKLLNYGFGGNIFGNFSHIRFYIIAAISGIALCIPDLKNKNYRIILFSVRMICLSYVLYFFMVFLPFLPLSVAAIIILGAGILMLTPLILTFIYIKQLINDFNYLKKLFKSYIVTIIAIYSFLALPIAIIIDYSLDKYTLNQALNYIYETDYLNSPAINIKRVKNLIGIIKENRKSRSSKLHKPYLSSFYKWYVFDNLTLSDKKINNIEKIIFGKSNFYTTANTSMPESNGVNIEKISHKTTYDYEKKYFTSTIDFYIKNDTNRQKEFLTTFNLPENAFITDYYLYIDNKKEMGLLCEKKSAAWVYQKITEQRRDPGILYYSDKDTIAFRVFPFNSFETRQTGFKIIHKNSIELKITNKIIKLAGDSIPLDNNESSIINKNIHYITIELKKELPTNNNAPE